MPCMAEFTFEWDRSQLKPFMNHTAEKAFFTAAKKAGGDGLRAARASAVKHIRTRKNIKATTIRDALVLQYAKGSHIDDLVWKLKVRDQKIPLGAYSPRQTKQGVSVRIGRKRELLRHAFIATMKSGHKGVFWRDLDSRKLTRRQQAERNRLKNPGPLRVKRLGIEELFSTKIIDLFRDRGMVDTVNKRAQSVFSTTFKRVLPLELARR